MLWCFYLLVTGVIMLAIFLQKNPIYSIFYFILSIINISCVLITLNVDFFAFALIIIYVGAIMILFLFIIMMLNIKVYQRNIYFFKFFPATFVIILFLLASFTYVDFSEKTYTSAHLINYINGFNYINWADQLYFIDTVKVIGYLLFTNYWMVVVFSSLLLLIAIIGSITLTLNQASQFKKQVMFRQIETSFKDLLKFKKTKWY